jgi:hypothetical protein
MIQRRNRSRILASKFSLTPDRVWQKLRNVETEWFDRLRPSLRNLSDVDKQARVEDWRKEVKDGIGRILDRQQRERLMELRIQCNGTMILTEPEMADELGLTGEQTKQIRRISESYWSGLNETLGSLSGGDKETIEKLAKLTEGFSNRMLEALTPQQRERFDKMRGKDFDFDALLSPPDALVASFDRIGERVRLRHAPITPDLPAGR